MASWARRARTEAVAARLEVRLEDRLEDQLHAGLHARGPERSGCQGAGTCPTPWGSSVPARADGTNLPALRSSRSTGRTVSLPKTMSRGFTPSTPADRAPRLPRTRSHATVRKAGSADEVEQVTEPTVRAVGRPLVQLGLDPQYPGLGFFKRRPWCVGVHRRPPGIASSVAADSLGPFAMWTAFPSSDYYGPSAPSRGHQPTADLPATDLAARGVGRPRDGSHVHHAPFDGSASSSSPAASPRLRRRPSPWPPGRRCTTDVGVVVPTFGDDTHRCPAHIHQVGAGFSLEGVQPLVHFRYASRSRLTDLGRLAVPTRPAVVRAASRPPQHLLGQTALSFNGLLRQSGRRVSHPPPDTWRLMAHLDHVKGIGDHRGVAP